MNYHIVSKFISDPERSSEKTIRHLGTCPYRLPIQRNHGRQEQIKKRNVSRHWSDSSNEMKVQIESIEKSEDLLN